MISISRATRRDIAAIRHLSASHSLTWKIDNSLFNSRDIALQARTPDGELVGFLWAGLMASNKVCYVSNLVVKLEVNNQGIAQLLYKTLADKLLKLGTEYIFGTIRRDKFHDRVCTAAIKQWGCSADELPHTYCVSTPQNILAVRDLVKG